MTMSPPNPTSTTRRRGGSQRLDIGSPVWIGLLVVVALLAGAFAAITKLPFDKANALAEVRIVAEQAHDVHLPAGFGVARVMVTDGQDIAAGDVIAVLDPAAIDGQIVALKVQAVATERQLELVRREAQGFSDLLEKRLVSRAKVAEFERQLADLERDATGILAQIARAEQQLKQQDIRALVSGRVTLVADAGLAPPLSLDVVVARIAPRTGRLVVEARLSPKDAQAWRVGQEVMVWLDGVSWLDGGPSRARLAWMAAIPATAEGIDTRMVAARLEVDANNIAIAAVMTELPGLRGGIVLRDGQRTLMQQLLDPIRRNFTRSSRV